MALTGVQRLEEAIRAARSASPLPEAPANVDACSNWLVELRVRALR